MRKGVFINLRKLISLKGKGRAQVATLIMLFIAVFFLLAAVLINIFKVASRRAAVINAATGSVIQLASNLGSWARMLSCTYLKCGVKKCKTSWLALIKLILTIIIIIVLIVITIICPPLGGSLWATLGTGVTTLAGFGAWAAVAFSVSVLVSTAMQFGVTDPKMYSAMNKAFAKMEPEMQMSESAIRAAFSNTVDDRAMMVDLYDFNMDGKYGFHKEKDPATGKDIDVPNDLIKRFDYKYQRRLLWLTDSGPGPDGLFRGYNTKLRALIAAFVSSLEDFEKKSIDFNKYLGDVDTLAPEGRVWRPRPPPSGDDPAQIESLFELFEYIQRREYDSVPLPWRNEVYNLSYHIDAQEKVVNIWTRGHVKCSGEEEEEPVPSDPCFHSQENDELDDLSLGLNDFNFNPTPKSCPSVDDEEFVGFSRSILCITEKERYVTFSSHWYPELYSECADDPPPLKIKDCEKVDYEDYYDQIWAVPDEANTQFLEEKGWREAINGWISRLGDIKLDIERRLGGWIGGGWGGGGERLRLMALLDKVIDARKKLSEFRQDIADFRDAIKTLSDEYNKLLKGEFEGTDPEGEFLLYSKNSPEYVWRDSHGRHSVKVEVSRFRLARLRAYRKRLIKRCVELKNHSGTVWVRVTRTDDAVDAELKPKNLPKTLLWRFQYPDISYTAKASYSYTAAPPVFLEIKKNK